MIEIRDVENAPLSDKHGSYGGASGLKDGIVLDECNWLVKYPKNASSLSRHEEMSYTNDPVSEYLGSHIYQILGFPTHETMLVRRHGKIAVACKDFVDDTKRQRLLEIRTIKNSANKELAVKLETELGSTGSAHVVELDELLLHLDYNDILTSVDGLKDRFFDMVVVDILINNSDRNNGNWGILREPGHKDCLAPIFDNGGSFNGKTPDSRLQKILDNPNGMNDSTGSCITAFGEDGSHYSIRKMIGLRIPELHEAIIRNVPKIESHLAEIMKLIDNVPDEACSTIRKEFYKRSLKCRFDTVLKPAYVDVKQSNAIEPSSAFGKTASISAF